MNGLLRLIYDLQFLDEQQTTVIRKKEENTRLV